MTEKQMESAPEQLPGKDLEIALAALAELVPDSVPPLAAESLRREHLYSREDDE